MQHTASSYGTLDDSHNDTRFLYNAPPLTRAAVMSIFAKYKQNRSLSFEGFEELLESLGLGKIHKISEHQSTLHDDDDHSDDEHSHHDHSANDGHSEDEHPHDDDDDDDDDDNHHDSHDHDEHEHSASSANCTDCLSAEVKCYLISTPAFISSQ